MFRIPLNTARRKLIEREAIALANAAKLGAEEVTLMYRDRHFGRAPHAGGLV
jgi:hypothetical protein